MSNISMEAQRQSDILKHNLRDQVRNLAVEYNTNTDTYNQQQTILNKYNYLLSLQNKELIGQVDKLEDIESNVATRDALVRNNQYAFNQKKKQIHVLKVFFTICAYLVFVIIAYLGKTISLAFLLTNIIAVLIVYSIYVAWIYDLFAFKDFTKFLKRDVEDLRRDIYQEGREIEDHLNEYINGQCDCPLTNGNGKKKHHKFHRKHFKSGTLPYNTGIYYYDGTAPQERIYPAVSNKENPNKFEIDWQVAPDYGSRDNKRYTPSPTWMSKTIGLPKGSNENKYNKCNKCSKVQNAEQKDVKTKYWTVDL